MKNKLITTLQSIGLNDKEADVYLSAVSLGPSSVLKIAQNAGLKRTTVYSVLESLKQKGLVKMNIRGWKTLFEAENPEKLESIVDQMRHEVRRALPEFASVYNLHSSGAFIKYYEGLEGIKQVYQDLLRDVRPHEDYLIISDSVQWLEQDPEFFSQFLERRSKLDINIRALLQDSDLARQYKKTERNLNWKVKILPAGHKLATNMLIIPRRVVINQLKPPLLAMVIENDSVIQMNRELFEIVWRSIPEKEDHLPFDNQVAEAKKGRGFKTAKEALKGL